MARQWIKEKKDNSWLYSVTSLHQEGNFSHISSIISGRPESHFIQKLRHLLLPVSPHPEKVQNMLIIHPSFQPTSWKLPYSQLETTPGVTHFSQHHGHGCPSLAVQKVWQTCSDSTVHKGGFEEGEVQCTFSPFHYDFFRIIFYSNASFPLLLFLEGTVYYICLGLNIR